MRRWRSAVVILLLVAAPALAQAPQQKLDSTLKHLQSSKEDESRIKRDLDKTRRDLDRLQERATDIAERLQRTERRAGNEEAAFARIDAQLNAKEKEFSVRRREYSSTITSLLRMRGVPATALFAKPDNVHQLLRTASVLENTNKAVAERAVGLKKEMARISDLRKQLAKSRGRVKGERDNLKKDQAKLAKELAGRQTLQKQLARDHAAAEAKVRQLSRESASLSELIGKLDRGKPVFAPARSSFSGGGNIRGSKGRLKAPVVGRLLHRFGERKNANETYRGVVLGARPGGTVVAPFAGEVVFTGPFMDYGRMVLLKHPDGYISLLAGLGNIAVSLNQSVRGGEPVGSMGPAATPKLYVELREHSKPVDPAGWFANLGVAQR